MPAKVYTDKDADLGVFANKTLAIRIPVHQT